MENEKIKDISILIAEDEVELLEYLKEYLQLFFTKVYSAKDGQEAYMIYLDKHPDIIVSDINMPGIDGLSLISKIRERDMLTKIIIMSAHSEADKLLKAVELHLETYLVKPIEAEKLKSVLFNSVESLRKVTKRVYLDSEVYWDKGTSTLWNNREQVMLKAKEISLLNILCENPNQAVSPESIFYAIYKNNVSKEFSADSVTSLLKRLRVKLPLGVIKNVYGAGYKIVSL